LTYVLCNADDSSDKRLEDEIQRCRDLLDDANRQISSMFDNICCSLFAVMNLETGTIIGFC